MSIAFAQASSNRVQASDARSAARDAFRPDAMVFSQWLTARANGDTALQNCPAPVVWSSSCVVVSTWGPPVGGPELVQEEWW
jgi:hypothetical protein